MRLMIGTLVGGALCMATPAIAGSGSDAAAQEPTGSEKMVCKRDRNSRATGSNMRVSDRVCKTEAEWARLEKDAQDTRRRMDDSAAQRLEPISRMGGGPIAGGPGNQ